MSDLQGWNYAFPRITREPGRCVIEPEPTVLRSPSSPRRSVWESPRRWQRRQAAAMAAFRGRVEEEQARLGEGIRRLTATSDAGLILEWEARTREVPAGIITRIGLKEARSEAVRDRYHMNVDTWYLIVVETTVSERPIQVWSTELFEPTANTVSKGLGHALQKPYGLGGSVSQAELEASRGFGRPP
jgi:hypothetical protein